MKEGIKVIEFDKYEIGIILNALTEFKNYISKTDINTDSINEIILKIIDSPEKKPFYRRLEER